MELINHFKDRHRKAVIRNFQEEADYSYTIKALQGRLYIAFQGVPIIGITPESTAQDILGRLDDLKRTFVAYKKAGYANDATSTQTA